MNNYVTKRNDDKLKDSIARIESENDPEKLLDELRQCLAISVETLLRLGAIIRRLETIGIDVFALEIPNFNYLRRIAHGQMMPELFIELAGMPGLLRKVSTLPLPDQKKIADGRPLKVMLHGGDHLLISPKDMTPSQVQQVFGRQGLRSEAQQVAWMTDRQQELSRKSVPRPEVELDRKRHGIRVGETFLSANDLAGYLAQLAAK